jgi:septum formation inhibitor-activating ATPase MinD
MNISLLLNDESLVEGFIHYNQLQRDEVTVYSSPESFIGMGLGLHIDVLIVSDKYFNYEGLCEFEDHLNSQNRGHMSKFLLLSNRHDRDMNAAFLKESLAAGWTVIRPGNSNTSIIDQLSAYIFGERDTRVAHNNHIIQFIGSTPNIGTTVAAFGIAAHMAKLTKRSIAYICLNLKSSKIHRYLGIDEPLNTLESLRAELKSMSLSTDRLRQHAWKVKEQPNLDVVFGNLQREQAEFYTLNDMDCLLQAAHDAYDYCIVDTNAYWDNAATISTMMKAGMRLMVTTSQLSHFQEDMSRWLQPCAPIFGCSPKSFDLLITQKERNPSSNHFSAREIRRETGMHKIGEIYKSKEIDLFLNQGKLWNAIENPGPISDNFSSVARTLLGLFGESLVHRDEQATWMRMMKGLFAPASRRMSLGRK